MHYQPKITPEELEYDGTCLLPERVVSMKDSGAIPQHPETPDVQARAPLLSTEQSLMLSYCCPNNPIKVNASSGLLAARKRICEGSARPTIICGVPPPFSCPMQKSGPVSNSYLQQRSLLCQGPLTEVSPDLCPRLTVDPILSNDDPDPEGYILSTLSSLESLKRKTDLLRIALWIVGSDFFRFQFLEPLVGDAMSCPSIVDNYGLKGQSIYTAFFSHLDMETFLCWECGHTVEEDLEAAIVHQRTMHFRHEPYRCHGLGDHCKGRFASQRMLHAHQTFAGH